MKMCLLSRRSGIFQKIPYEPEMALLAQERSNDRAVHSDGRCLIKAAHPRGRRVCWDSWLPSSSAADPMQPPATAGPPSSVRWDAGLGIHKQVRSRHF